MSNTAQNLDETGRKQSDAFEEISSYERLIILRRESPDDYLLRTSQATRAALGYYERQKAQNRESE
jgi:hypothetical protein